MNKLIYTTPIFTHQIDFAGHVNNGVYFQWLEEARQLLLAAVGFPIPRLMVEGTIPVLANLSIIYKQPLYLSNTMHLEMWFTEVRNASVIILGEIYNEIGILAARATQQALFIDGKTHKPLRMSHSKREQFRQYLICPNE